MGEDNLSDVASAMLAARLGGAPEEILMHIDDARALGYEGEPCRCAEAGGREHFHWKA